MAGGGEGGRDAVLWRKRERLGQASRYSRKHRGWWTKCWWEHKFLDGAGPAAARGSQKAVAGDGGKSLDEKVAFLQTMFSAEIDAPIIADVLGFCKEDVDNATQYLLRMVSNKDSSQGEDAKQGNSNLKKLKELFPELDNKVLQNALDAAAGSHEEATTLLRFEYSENDAAEVDQRADDAFSSAAKRAGGDSSWTEVVNQSKYKRQIKSLEDLFVDCEGDFLEDIFYQFDKNLDKAIDYLSNTMNLVMKAPAPATTNIVHPGKSAASFTKAKKEEEGHYTEYRERASYADANMRLCYEQASNAFSNGYMKQAKELSRRGHAFLKERNEWRLKAAEGTVKSMNSERSSYFPLDLHGLTTEEATLILKNLVESLSKVPGKKVLEVIVGQGRGSQRGISKLKPVVEDFLRSRNLFYSVPDNNPGVFYVHLDGSKAKYIRKA